MMSVLPDSRSAPVDLPGTPDRTVKSGTPASSASEASGFAALVDAARFGDSAVQVDPPRVSAAAEDLPDASPGIELNEDAEASKVAEQLSGNVLPTGGQIMPFQLVPTALIYSATGAVRLDSTSADSDEPVAGIRTNPGVPGAAPHPLPPTPAAQPGFDLPDLEGGDSPSEVAGDTPTPLESAKSAGLTRANGAESVVTASAPAAPTPGNAAAPHAATAGRSEAPAVAELEITITQVNEIREALRSARPQMHLHHAEFGLVSLRLEGSGQPHDWRAVLASRDPGFAPAFQAALAERALSTSAGVSSHSLGSGTGQGQGSFASFEQRYGFSPGSQQGSSLPYMAQSQQRDEGASQHRERHQRSDKGPLAARLHDDGLSDERDQGLFA